MKTPPSRFPLLSGLASLALFGAAAGAGAQTLLDDDFSTGPVRDNRQNLPASSSWYMTVNNNSSASLVVDTEDEELVFSTVQATSNLLTYFTPSGSPQNLEIGQTISLTLQLEMSAVTNADIRFGLFNSRNSRLLSDNTSNFQNAAFSNWRGYSVWFNTTSEGANYNIYERIGTSNAIFSSDTNVNTLIGGNNTANIGMGSNTLTTFSLEITRTAENMFSLLSSVNGVELSRTDAPTATLGYSFDTFAIQFPTAVPGNGGTVTIHSIQVALVPEPSVLGMLGMGAVGGVLLRRKRVTNPSRKW